MPRAARLAFNHISGVKKIIASGESFSPSTLLRSLSLFEKVLFSSSPPITHVVKRRKRLYLSCMPESGWVAGRLPHRLHGFSFLPECIGL